MLTEKISQSALTESLYHDFKRSNGVSEEEIIEKKQRLQGVLVTYPLSWYMDTLNTLGFHQVDVINANNGFVTFLAQSGNINI